MRPEPGARRCYRCLEAALHFHPVDQVPVCNEHMPKAPVKVDPAKEPIPDTPRAPMLLPPDFGTIDWDDKTKQFCQALEGGYIGEITPMLDLQLIKNALVEACAHGRISYLEFNVAYTKACEMLRQVAAP